LEEDLILADQTPGVFKRCSCGTSYSREGWEALRDLGTAELGGKLLEYRLCGACESTLTAEVSPGKGESPGGSRIPATPRGGKRRWRGR